MLIIATLFPLLNSPYISDDSINSFVRGSLRENNQGLFQFTYSLQKGLFYGQGRFIPLAAYYPFLFYFFDRFQYKMILLLLVLLNIILFAYFIKLITQSSALSFFSLLLPPLFFQFRYCPDPILAFNGLQQSVFFYTIASLIFLIFYLEKRKIYFLALSLWTYLCGLLTYEITYVFFIFSFVTIYFYSDERKFVDIVKDILPFIFLPILVVLTLLFLRLSAGMWWVGVKGGAHIPNFDLKTYLMTLAKQTSAAFPLSYYLILNGLSAKAFHNSLVYLRASFSFVHVFIIFGYFLLSRKYLEELAHLKSRPNMKYVLSLGISLLILPGALTSLSPKYQHQDYIGWGIGYLPVYLSYFGLLMLSLALLFSIYRLKFIQSHRKFASALSIIISLFFCCIGAINYTHNNIVVDGLNGTYPREVLENGIKNGLFSIVPEKAYLIVDSNYPWDRPPFYRMHHNKKLSHVGPKGNHMGSLPQNTRASKIEEYSLYRFHPNSNVFYLYYKSHSKECGYVVLTKVNDLIGNNQTLLGVASEMVYVYVQAPPSDESIYIQGILLDRSNFNECGSFLFEDVKINLIASGIGWKLYSVSGGDKLIDALSVSVVRADVRKPSVFLTQANSLTSLPSEANNISYCVDYFNQNHDSISLAGWAYIMGKSSIGSTIYIVLKSAEKSYLFLPTSHKRPDVTAHFKSLNFDDSGFSITINKNKLEPGTYKVGIYIRKINIEALQYTDREIKIEK